MWRSVRKMSAEDIKRVLDFWFGQKSNPDYLMQKSFWYGSPTDDQYVRQHLAHDYELARSGQLDHWKELDSGEGALVLIILLDQVPRNIFRDTPQAYATDGKALSVAKHAVTKEWDKTMPKTCRRYLYSPFNHSENLNDQKMSVKLFTELGDPHHLHWAKDFYQQIKTNGRFVHRDRILGRR